MFVTTSLAILAVLSTSVAVWDRITSQIRKTVIAASILVAISVLSQVVQIVDKHEQGSKLAQQQQIIWDKDIFLASKLGAMDEASGGAIFENLAYVVDDDVPSIFVLEYIDSESRYKFKNLEPTRMLDARPCAERLDWNPECNDSEPTELTKNLIEDLEGAAVYNNKLYLTTSQSVPEDKSEPQRWLFLEVSPDGKVIRATRKIRQAILEILKSGIHNIDTSNKLNEIEVEGLAIDSNGLAYLGFRSPLVLGRALVLRAPVEALFGDKPSFEPFVLDLEQRGNHYGITSLDYDPKRNEILVLGNSSTKTKTLPPVVWTWTVKDSASAQGLKPYDGEIFSNFTDPGTRPAKPEVILLPQENRIHLFFDAQGNGGQLGLLRNGNKISRADATKPH